MNLLFPHIRIHPEIIKVSPQICAESTGQRELTPAHNQGHGGYTQGYPYSHQRHRNHERSIVISTSRISLLEVLVLRLPLGPLNLFLVPIPSAFLSKFPHLTPLLAES